MRPYAIVACALATALTFVSVDLQACGDKFMRVGRSARLGGYASTHRASILVYQPIKPDAKRKREFEDILTKAGHTVTFVPHGTNVAQAAAAYKYDLIVTMLADAPTVAEQIRSLPARPDIVASVEAPTDKAAKALDVEAQKTYHCILAPYRMNKYDALEEIDHAMDTRLKALSPAGAPKK
jgi:CheY-like chemotaxis protein